MNSYQQINRKCSKNDINCWKYELQKRFHCYRGDQQCWKHIMPRLPCNLNDTKCWKEQLPNVPCEVTDIKCWDRIIPHPPCEILDTDCWKSYRKFQAKKEIDHIINELQHTLTDQTQAMID